MNWHTKWMAGLIAGGSLAAAQAQPTTGMPIAALEGLDNLVLNHMDENDIPGGLVAIMKDGVIIYQRGFGWKDEDRTIPLRHDAIMRLASLTKPITAASVQELFLAGDLSPADNVFDLGQPGGGVLLEYDYPPFPSLGDSNFDWISVGMLYTHTSGMAENGEGDPTREERQIARDFNRAGENASTPPGRPRTLRWILGKPLASVPGFARIYSNAGFMTLGMVVEQVAEQNLVDFARETVFGPLDWVPVTELVRGRTFQHNHDPREPWYDGGRCWDVFGTRSRVDCPYGAWDHEARIGQGGMVASTTIMLHLAENYYVSDGGWGDPTYGARTNGVRDFRAHSGGLKGSSTWVCSRTDGINISVMFNKRDDESFAADLGVLINALFNDWQLPDSEFVWPTQGVDGQWVDLNNPAAGDGSYENGWSDVTVAATDAADEATLNFHSGTANWTGVINKPLRLRAPEPGVSALIGVAE